MDELDDLRLTLHRDPRHVAERTTALAAQALADGARARRSRCLAVRGRARRALGQMELAELDLRQAVDDATGPDADHLAADAYLGLAGVLAWAGRTAEAYECLDRATELGDEQTVAYALLQRASVSQRAGHLSEALATYEHALPALRRLDLRTDQALVHMNRGMIRVNTGDLAGAFDDLQRAETLFANEGNDFGVAQVRHGTGVAHLRAGDLPAALRTLDDASERFGVLGHDALDVQVDRVEALLAAGLAADAAAAAADLAPRFADAGSHSLAAEVWLRGAQAARFDGDLVGALERAEVACRLFGEQGALGWERQARLEVHRVEAAVGRGSVDALAALGDELVTAGDPSGAATAHALACQVALASGDGARASALAERCAAQAATVDVLEVRLLAADATAAAVAATGDTRAARRVLRRGLDDLARHRATLGAPEARAAIAGHAAGLVRTGLRMAAAGGGAAAVFEWNERALAGRGLRTAPGLAHDDDIAASLASLRRVMSEVRARRAEGDGDVVGLLAEQRRIEHAIQRRHLLATGGAEAPFRPPTLVDVRAQLGARHLVSLVEVDDRLLAVSATARRGRLVDLGTVAHAVDLVGAAGSGLRALADRTLAGTRRDRRVSHLLEALDALGALIRPALAGDGPVLLVLPASLHHAPWGAVPDLAGRPLAVAPSVAWWLDRPHDRRPRDTVFVAAGPDLAYGVPEVCAVAAAHPTTATTVVTGTDATGDAVRRGLRTAGIAHVVAHGRIRHDNPSWSALDLVDGPLSLYELERESDISPVVVLSACESGVGVHAGDQLVGLSSCLLRHGTRSLVAPVCRLPDTAVTVDLMAALHHRLAAGDDAATALAGLDRGEPGDDRWIHAACLAAFGEV